jgi:type II secretory pathway component PulJ
MRRRERGYSLLEVVVMLAVFGVVLVIFFTLTAELRLWEKRLPVNYMRHPQVAAVMMRLRKDVLDAYMPLGPYVDEEGDYESGEKILIIATLLEEGTVQTVVWDFSKPGVVQRIAYNTGLKAGTWTARGLPVEFSKEVGIAAVEFEGRPYGVQIRATDEDGRIAIDQILQPRSHTPLEEKEEEEVPPETAT